MALLEVIIAMTVFAIAALSAAMWVRQMTHAAEAARQRSIQVRAASAYLDRIALWPREDLDRHLGARRQGPYVVSILRPSPTVYTAALLDSTGMHQLLQTSLYRPEMSHVAP